MCLTFQMMTLEKYLTKNLEIFLGGTPKSVSKNDHPGTPYDPIFLF